MWEAEKAEPLKGPWLVVHPDYPGSAKVISGYLNLFLHSSQCLELHATFPSIIEHFRAEVAYPIIFHLLPVTDIINQSWYFFLLKLNVDSNYFHTKLQSVNTN